MLSQQNKRTFSILLVSSFAATLGLAIIVPILPIYAQTLGASGIWVGLIFASFSIGKFFVMPIAGRLSDRSGRKNFITVGLFLYSMVSFLYVFAESPQALTLFRFGQGCAAAMILPIAQAYAGDLSPTNSEGKYMGIFTFALFAGFGFGPVMGGFLKDLYGINCSIYALSALTFIAGLVSLLLLPDIQHKKKNPALPGGTVFKALGSRVVRGVLVFRTTTALCRGAIIAFVPLFAYNTLKLSSSQIGIIISGNVLLTSILQAPFGMLADTMSRKKLVIWGGIIVSGLILIIPLVKTFTQLLVLSLFYGFFGAMVLPAATAIMVNEGRIYGMGAAMTLFTMSMDLGLAAGPLAGGWLTDVLGLNSVFYLFSLIGLLGVGFFSLPAHQA